jgi:hypothetical protein
MVISSSGGLATMGARRRGIRKCGPQLVGPMGRDTSMRASGLNRSRLQPKHIQIVLFVLVVRWSNSHTILTSDEHTSQCDMYGRSSERAGNGAFPSPRWTSMSGTLKLFLSIPSSHPVAGILAFPIVLWRTSTSRSTLRIARSTLTPGQQCPPSVDP